MIKVKKAVGLLLAVTTLVGSTFVANYQSHAATALRVGGSTTIAPLAKNLEGNFETWTGNAVDVVITEGGSGAGLNGVIDGTLDVGMMSRDLTASEKTTYPYLIPITVGKDAIAIIVNPSNPIANLSKSQVKDIFSSSSTSPITNWKQLGGSDAGIVVHTRADGSGTLDAFKELALEKTSVISSAKVHPSSEELSNAVAVDINAIGFVSLGYVDTTMKPLKIDNVECTVYNAKNAIYPFVRPLNYVTKREPIGNALKWIYYNLGKEAQDQIESKRYIRVNDSQLEIAVADSSIQSVASQVAGELDDGIALTMSISTFASQDAALEDVRTEKKEAAIIKGPLTADWTSKGLAGKEVAQDASGNKYTFVTKAFGSVEALGAAEVFRYVLRNPRGQKIAIKYGLNRVWKFGDVTGDGLVNSADYANLRSYLLKKVASLPAPAWLFSADVTGDNRIDSADASVLQAYLLKKPTQYPTIQAEKAYTNYYPPMP